jgi:hypothetical protein
MRRQLLQLSLAAWCVLAGQSLLRAHEGEEGGDTEDVVVLFGSGALTPPEGAANQEATGFVHLRQKGDRNAVHIRVAHLEPGATYDVRATKGETSASIGSITTHDGMPPPPRCFSAKLSVPAPAEEEAGDGAGGHDRHRPGGDGTVTPRGYAIFHLNDEGTALKYWIVARGIGEIASASLKIGDATGELEADGQGSFDVTAEQLAALAAGQGSVTVVGSGDPPVTISGAVGICFEELREERAARKAGRGALRIDTSRGDTLPLDAATIADLVGVTFSVVDSTGGVVLAGSVAELMEGGRHRPDDGHPGDPPGADEDCEANLARPDPAPDADAAGEVEIEGEELEVEVFRLAARALYDVVLTEPQEGGATATLGQIKTGWSGSANQEFVAEEGVALPFGKTKISELVGHKVEIKDAEGAVVLLGAIPATACAAEADRFTRDHDDDGDDAGGGGALDASPPDAYFQLDESHDASFIRGDANDDGGVDLADAVSVLLYLFQGQTTPYCTDASDADDSGALTISDPIVILQFLYQGSSTMAAPYPLKGYDSTADELFCSPFSG